MKNTVENNLKVWDREYDWSRDGDEWDGQARVCRQPYDLWKRSLVETFLLPNAGSNAVVLEIAPGHGRWSKELVGCKELVLVDLSPSCIEFCRKLLASLPHVRYVVNDGRTLAAVGDATVDFVWSYDAFVHMDRATVRSYLGEIARVLKPGGKAIIHHAGRRHAFLWLRFLRDTPVGRTLYKLASMGQPGDSDGWRSDISRQLFRGLAANSGLEVEAQLQRWGKNREFGVPRFGDFLSVLTRR